MKAQITHTGQCRKCNHDIDFDLSKMISTLLQDRSIQLICPRCSSPNPYILIGAPDIANRFLNIEKELNNLLIKRLKEEGFLRLSIVTPK